MRKLAIILSSLSVLLLALPASALTYKTVSRVNGTAAEAVWESVDGNVVTDTYVAADVTNLGSEVYLEVDTFNTETSDFTCKNAYVLTPDASLFTVNKLNSATLNPVTVELYDCFTLEDMGSTTVQANWTGAGKTVKQSVVFRTRGGFSETFKSTSVLRNASATGSLNSVDLGSSFLADLVQFKQMDMTRVK